MPPIDIYSAIGDAEVVLMWRPMPRQFGAYINELRSRPGILVNNGLPHAAQRHTAAHELGHHRLGHRSTTDENLDPPDKGWSGWTDEEKVAESFASWFLMPRRAVLTALGRLGLERPQSPDDVYMLALLLGTSYRSTIRHLPNLRLASRDLARQWARVPPKKIKARLDNAALPPTSSSSDVWVIDKNFAGTELTVHLGDRLIVTVTNDAKASIDPPEAFRVMPASAAMPSPTDTSTPTTSAQGLSNALILEVEQIVPSRVEIFGSANSQVNKWAFDVQVEERHSGLARRWIE
ncbi:uncharacterized protein DUF955 [Actinoallomurus bryophytorum]|uniref:Uncharacterized protein DUF955 n=1 Tax=Actinoallomurus bryophytorum TaxID=1490222 RepID=A0A543CKT6_9ACTN|nr:uncharacterized protein DUF955 [Actinoallomurus bryophytorum]